MTLSRERIVDAALDLLEAEGSAAVTMKAVADALGVTTPALYRHVDGQEALFALLRGRAWERFGAALLGGIAAPDPRARLAGIGRAYLHFGLRHRHVYDLLFREQPDQPLPEGSPRHGPSFQLLLDRLAEARAAGLLRADVDPYAAAMGLWATVHGLVTLYAGGGARRALDEAGYQALAEQVLETHLRLLGS